MEEDIYDPSLLDWEQETIKALADDIIPQLVSQARQTQQELRLWVAECGRGDMVTLLALLLMRHTLPSRSLVHYQIFATARDEAQLAAARRCTLQPAHYALLSEQERPIVCEPTESGYRLGSAIRKLIVFGCHDPFHDPPLAHVDLLLCGFNLQTQSSERQQHVLNQAYRSLKPGGYLVCSQFEKQLLVRFAFTQVYTDLPIYQPIFSSRSSVSTTSSSSSGQELPSAQALRQALRHGVQGAAAQLDLANQPPKADGVQAPQAMESLLHLAPLGIVMLSQHYQVLFYNRAASKLFAPQQWRQAHLDFFHGTPGLPYQQVRVAIDQVLREGTSQVLPEVELTVSAGGSGRVLSLEIFAPPTEVGEAPRVVLYAQDATMQTVHKRIQEQQAQAIQTLSTCQAVLTNRCNELERAYEHLQEVSQQLLLDHEQMVVEYRQLQEAYTQQEDEMVELQAEITLLHERPDP